MLARRATARQEWDLERILKIPAVVFADGGSQGEAWQIAFIKALRLGKTLELERIERILDSFGTDDTLTNTGVASVIAAVGTPPRLAEEAADSIKDLVADRLGMFEAVQNDAKAREGLSSGISFARQEVLRDLGDVSSSLTSPLSESGQRGATGFGHPESIVELRNRIKALAAKQKADLELMQ